MPNSLRDNVLAISMTYRWLQLEDDLCRYVANDEKNTIAAEITKCDRTKWQITVRDTDGAMTELPEFCERLSVAQLVVEAKLRCAESGDTDSGAVGPS